MAGEINNENPPVTETPEQTIARLTAANQELDRKYTDLLIAHNTLQADHAKLTETAAAEIEALSKQASSAREDANKGIVTVELDGQKYQVIGQKFSIPGKGVLSLDQLLKDEKTLKEMVAKGSGHLREVE